MNPLVAPHIQRYPVIPANGVISEVWHARKWRHDVDRHILSPMYDAGNGIHYFIDEPAILSNSTIVVPVRWLQDDKGGIWGDAWEVEYDEITVGLLFPVDLKIDMFFCRTCQQSKTIMLS
jgi:hypothetical protein